MNNRECHRCGKPINHWGLCDECNKWPRVAECDECPYDSICDRCAATMLQYAEPGKKPDKLCERTRYFVKNGIYRIAECER